MATSVTETPKLAFLTNQSAGPATLVLPLLTSVHPARGASTIVPASLGTRLTMTYRIASRTYQSAGLATSAPTLRITVYPAHGVSMTVLASLGTRLTITWRIVFQITQLHPRLHLMLPKVLPNHPFLGIVFHLCSWILMESVSVSLPTSLSMETVSVLSPGRL